MRYSNYLNSALRSAQSNVSFSRYRDFIGDEYLEEEFLNWQNFDDASEDEENWQKYLHGNKL